VFSGIFGSGAELSLDKLLKKARSNTRLFDLGNDFNEDALKILVKSINEEAALHPFGRLMIKEKLISQLENRLWAEHWFKKFPDILSQEVLPVILITGMQRTGTTKMQRLLSAFPGARALQSWEALYPAPIGEAAETSKRLRRTRRNEMAVKWISPVFQSIHPISTDKPEEDVLLLDLQFMSSTSEAIMHVPSFANWLSAQDHTEAYLYEKKLLKLLQRQRGGKYWVLKSPHHLEYLDVFTNVFPDTRIVWMHRSIEDCLPSFFSMLYFSRAMFAHEPDKKAIVDHWMNKVINILQRGIHYRAAHADKVIDVFFEDFLKSETDVIWKIDQAFNLTMANDRREMQMEGDRYMSKHRYNLEDWDVDKDELYLRFDFYHKSIFGQDIHGKSRKIR
jgi:hypothetical protein